MRNKKLSENQLLALRRVKAWSMPDGSFMPTSVEVRTFEACVRKGMLTYQSVSDGHRYNGYVLTEAGKKEIAR